MSDDIIKRLRVAIAAGPTPGPWCVYPETDGTEICAVDDAPGLPIRAIIASPVRGANWISNGRYIAAASPDNIAALLDRLEAAERLRAERDEHARWRANLADKLHDAESQISAAWAALRRAGIQSEETVAEAIALLHAAQSDERREG